MKLPRKLYDHIRSLFGLPRKGPPPALRHYSRCIQCGRPTLSILGSDPRCYDCRQAEGEWSSYAKSMDKRTRRLDKKSK